MDICERKHFHPHRRIFKDKPIAVGISPFLQYGTKSGLAGPVWPVDRSDTFAYGMSGGIADHYLAISEPLTLKFDQVVIPFHQMYPF